MMDTPNRDDRVTRPVFLISQPRSGSTLLQKMLAVSPEVCTIAEPWINLPLAAMGDREMVVAEYWQATASQALDDFCTELPGGRPEFIEATSNYVRDLYARIASRRPGATVFLDKTPRYYMILPYLAEAFPDAKFIFLMRNPVDVLASILNTWHRNRITPNLKGNLVDIVNGPRQMSEGIHLLGDRARVVHYGDLVSDPEKELKVLCDYMGIAYADKMVTDYREVTFAGNMGDPTGVKKYQGVSTGSVGKWQAGIGSRFRKIAVKRYVAYLGDDVLKDFGTDRATLLAQVNAAPATLRGSMRDLIGYCWLRLSIIGNQWSLGTGRRFFQRMRRRPVLPYG